MSEDEFPSPPGFKARRQVLAGRQCQELGVQCQVPAKRSGRESMPRIEDPVTATPQPHSLNTAAWLLQPRCPSPTRGCSITPLRQRCHSLDVEALIQLPRYCQLDTLQISTRRPRAGIPRHTNHGRLDIIPRYTNHGRLDIVSFDTVALIPLP